MTKSTEIKYNKWYSFKEKMPQPKKLFIALTEPNEEGICYIYQAWLNDFGQIYSSKEVATEDWLDPQNYTHWCYINEPPMFEV